MSLTLQFILAMSCLIPAIPAAIKFRKTDRSYHPFFLLIIAAVATELIADIPFMLYNNYDFMDIVHPVYSVLDIYLMLLFYRRIKIIETDTLIWVMPLTGIIIFSAHYYFNNDTSKIFEKYCKIIFTGLNIALAIKLLSNEIFETKTKAFKNPKMIIAFGCTLSYSFYLLTTIFLGLGPQIDSLIGNIFSIHQIINVLTYLIFTWAIIWIPTKERY